MEIQHSTAIFPSMVNFPAWFSRGLNPESPWTVEVSSTRSSNPVSRLLPRKMNGTNVIFLLKRCERNLIAIWVYFFANSIKPIVIIHVLLSFGVFVGISIGPRHWEVVWPWSWYPSQETFDPALEERPPGVQEFDVMKISQNPSRQCPVTQSVRFCHILSNFFCWKDPTHKSHKDFRPVHLWT